MDKVADSYYAYFGRPQKYIWSWAEKDEVLQWMDGSTIGYRQDLSFLLQQLIPTGLPPFGSVLLVLTACRNDWKVIRSQVGKLQFIRMAHESDGAGLAEAKKAMDELFFGLDEALRFLDVVAGCAEEFRTGKGRMQLLQTIFDTWRRKVPETEARRLLMEFEGGVFAPEMEPSPRRSFASRLKADIAPLMAARTLFYNSIALENKIRTGVQQAPEPIEIPLETPEPLSDDLLDQLASDDATRGLAQLTRRLVAALHIPIHAEGSSDQLFGGVSDITNRGEFDRLLLSELASDDLSLMARLANNEALYLRREELPTNLDHQRFVLVDSTLQLWGTSRVFALSAALACAAQKKDDTSLCSFSFGGKKETAIDLETKDGVLEALGQLDPALHCGRALQEFMERQKPSAANEYFFITDEEVYRSAEFLPYFTAIQSRLHYLITVGRKGQLQFYEFISGRRKLLLTAQFDLDELLFPPRPERRGQESFARGSMPAFMTLHRAPLFLPASKMGNEPQQWLPSHHLGQFAVTQDYRLLHWARRESGAVELATGIVPGRYCLGSDDLDNVHVLVFNFGKRPSGVLTYSFSKAEAKFHPISHSVLQPFEMAYINNRFYIRDRLGLWKLEPGKKTPERFQKHNPSDEDVMNQVMSKRISDHKEAWRRNAFFRSDNAYTKPKRIYVNGNGQVAVGHRAFVSYPNGIVFEKCPSGDGDPVFASNQLLTKYEAYPSKSVQFYKYSWKEGSEVILDTRGLLHFRSAHASVPEFTLLILAENRVAGWAADNQLTGPEYYTGVPEKETMGAEAFYNRYLKPFADNLY